MQVSTFTMRLASLMNVQSSYRKCGLQWVNHIAIVRPALRGSGFEIVKSSKFLKVKLGRGIEQYKSYSDSTIYESKANVVALLL